MAWAKFRSKIVKMDGDSGETENLNTNYNQLLKQIQNLSELQSSGAIQNADPNLQVHYLIDLLNIDN